MDQLRSRVDQPAPNADGDNKNPPNPPTDGGENQ